MEARVYKLFGDHELALARAGIDERTAPWIQDWLPNRAALCIDCLPACDATDHVLGESDTAGWRRLAVDQERWICYHAPAQVKRSLIERMFGQHATVTAASEVAEEVAETALLELAACLLQGPLQALDQKRAQGARPHPDTWSAGSACLLIRATLGEGRVDLIASATWARTLLQGKGRRRPTAALASREESIARHNVPLRVLAGSVEVDVRTFSRLRRGDVISLETRIDEPMTVIMASGAERVACVAFLGTLRGRRAVSLVARDS